MIPHAGPALLAAAVLALTNHFPQGAPLGASRQPKAVQFAAARLVDQLIDGLTDTSDSVDYDIETRIHAAREAAASGKVLDWGRAVLPHVFNLPFCPLHHYQVENRHEPQDALEAPRGHSKTTVGTLIKLYQGLVEPETYRHYLSIQSNGDKAALVNIFIKLEIEENPVIRAIYGDQVGKKQWNNSLFVLDNGVAYSAIGAGQSLRGIQWRGMRPDNTDLDDLYDEEDINKPDATKKKTDWFWGTLFPARSKSRTSRFGVKGTAINEEDILFKLEKDKNFKFARFAATKPDGTPLWPELNSTADLKKERESMGSVIYEREMEMSRRNDATSIIKPSWLDSWEREPAEFNTERGEYRLLGTLVGVDPSIGKNKSINDPAAYVRVWKLLHTQTPQALPVFFIDSIRNEHLSLNGRISAAKEMVSTSRTDRPVTRMRVEAIGGFDDIAELIVKAVSVPCDTIPKVTDKDTNLEKHSKYFENGRVFLNKNIDPVLKDLLRNQLTINRPSHDDIRDALFLVLDDEYQGWEAWV